MNKKLALFAIVFLITACFVSAQNDFSASGKAAVNACACSTATIGFVVKNTGSAASTFHVQQSGNAAKYLVSAPLSFTLKPGEEQVVASVFSAPCGSSGVYRLNSIISNAAVSKKMSQQFNVQQCSNGQKTPVNKPSVKYGSFIAALWSTTAGKALIALPIMIIIVVLVILLAKRLAENITEKRAWEQPHRLVLKQPKHYSWEKMFKPEEEHVEITSPRRINWSLIITIFAFVILIALLACATYYAAKSGVFSKHAAANITKNVTVPEKNLTKPVVVNATKAAGANFSKFSVAIGNFANKVGSTMNRSAVKYSIIGVIAAAILIALIMLFRHFIGKHWKLLLFIILTLAVIACVWCYAYWNWVKVIGWLVVLRNFFVSYWLYIVSGLVVLGVIIAVILAVRSEDSGAEVVEVKAAAPKPSRRKKSSKRKK